MYVKHHLLSVVAPYRAAYKADILEWTLILICGGTISKVP